jgi:integrase
MNQSSFGEYTRMIGMFLRIIKHINHNTIPRVSELTVDMIREYKTIFSEIPRSVRTEDKSIEKLLSMKREKKSPSTIKNTFGNVGHFIQWLSGEGYPIQSNIHDVLTHYRNIKKSEKKRRVPLDEKDLKALFLSDNYRLGKWKRESEFWAPLIALFTGMTRSEIIQLEADDIYKQYNSYVFDVNDRGSKTLKAPSSIDDENESSTGRKRIIPVHKQLIDIGLIEFVTHQKKRGETKLFPCEERNNRSHFGAYGNRFSNYRKKVGVVPRHDKELRDFHSFRHLMKTKLREVEIDDGIIDDILGHTSTLRSTVGRTYDHSNRLKFKTEAINKLKHDCIDFSLIKPWQQNRFARGNPYSSRRKTSSTSAA